MRPDLLHVVCVYANPLRWKSRARVHKKFEQHMLDSGVRLTTVECAYGDRPYELPEDPRINRVQVRAKTLVWTKENLINIGVSRLPDDWKYVAWIDADVFFRRGDWATEVVYALQQYNIIQPWSDSYDLGPNDEHLHAYKSFCSLYWKRSPVAKEGPNWWDFEGGEYRYAHTGYAWACTRASFEFLGGLLEIGALGAGDHHMALGLVDKAAFSMPGGVSRHYREAIMQWQDRAVRHLNRNIGFIYGTIEHQWHGRKEDRKYVDRWSIIIKHAFDPIYDLKRNSHRVLELAGNKPDLTRDVDAYFRQRNEDANTLD